MPHLSRQLLWMRPWPSNLAHGNAMAATPVRARQRGVLPSDRAHVFPRGLAVVSVTKRVSPHSCCLLHPPTTHPLAAGSFSQRLAGWLLMLTPTDADHSTATYIVPGDSDRPCQRVSSPSVPVPLVRDAPCLERRVRQDAGYCAGVRGGLAGPQGAGRGRGNGGYRLQVNGITVPPSLLAGAMSAYLRFTLLEGWRSEDASLGFKTLQKPLPG